MTNEVCPLCDEWLEGDADVAVFAASPVLDNTLAHRSCIGRLADDIEHAETVEEVRDCVDRYCRGANETGGSLHIVLDDYGYDDSALRWCIERAEEGSEDEPWDFDSSGPPDPLGAALGRKLLGMSLVDRAAANDARSCATCGHALSLHHWTHPSGRWGYSCCGPCEIEGCDCAATG